jgi:molybdopterin molybdotransferase
VCPLEDCLSEDGRLEIQGPLAPGAHIRRAGEDTGVGAVVAEAGAWLGAGLLGQLRAVGCHSVRVHRRPRVGVLSTGDELVHGAGRPGGINDSNRAMLGALLAAEGFSPVDLGVVADEPAAVTEALCEGVADCDAVVSTGGVSVGDRDVVRDVLTEVPTTAARWFQVAIKPAKPLAFAVVASPREVPVFGLPGNPVSALVSCELFAVPALRRMAGHRTDRRQVAAVAAVAFRRRPDHKVHLVASVATVDAEGVLKVRPTGPQGSHRLSSVAGANALAVVPNGEGIGAGERLQVLLVPGLGALGTEWSAPSAATAPVSDAASC